ncbi:MAG: DNA-binding protein [Crocinitomicaceae bacterium]|nr:DNA-binding protein [Crocinitomicaceae bacterium]
MGRSQETFNKKEKEKKRLKKREEKQKKREERKANSKKGEGFEEMFAYVDENGQITDTPPDLTKKKVEIKAENIEIGVPKRTEEENDPVRKGKVVFFDSSKGYGFVRDTDDDEKYFVHVSGLLDGEISENDSITFELEKGMNGLNAVRVKKV